MAAAGSVEDGREDAEEATAEETGVFDEAGEELALDVPEEAWNDEEEDAGLE